MDEVSEARAGGGTPVGGAGGDASGGDTPGGDRSGGEVSGGDTVGEVSGGEAVGLAGLAPSERHRLVAARFGALVTQATDWMAPTPVPEWRAADVVRHLVGWLPAFLAGGGVELPAGPSVDDDPAAAWAAQAASVQALLDDDDRSAVTFTHPQAGTHDLAAAIDRYYTADVFMHTWDLARALGADDELDGSWAAELLAGMEPIEEMLRASGQYGPRMPVADDASPGLRLMAFVGRDPAWAPPAAS